MSRIILSEEITIVFVFFCFFAFQDVKLANLAKSVKGHVTVQVAHVTHLPDVASVLQEGLDRGVKKVN